MLPTLINAETSTSDERAQFIRQARTAIAAGDVPTVELQRCVIACLHVERAALMQPRARASGTASSSRTAVALSDDDL